MTEEVAPYGEKPWWTVYYLNANRLLGAAIVQGSSADDAVEECARRGIEPGPCVAGAEIVRREYLPGDEFRNRLLSGEELARSRGRS